MSPRPDQETTGTVAALTELRASVTTDITRLCRDVDKLFQGTTDLHVAKAAIETRLETTRGEILARVDALQRSLDLVTEKTGKFRPEDYVTRYDLLQHDRESDKVVLNVAGLMTDVDDLDTRLSSLSTSIEAAISKQLSPVIESIKADRDGVKEDRKTITDLKEKVNGLMLKFSIVTVIAGLVLGKIIDFMLKASGLQGK